METLIPFTYKASVVRVIDGDTLVLDIDVGFGFLHKNVTCRVLGINTPEMKGAEKELGKQVKQEVEKILPIGSLVTIQSVKLDHFGRSLIVLQGEFGDLAEYLIEKGLAVKWDGTGARPKFVTP